MDRSREDLISYNIFTRTIQLKVPSTLIKKRLETWKHAKRPQKKVTGYLKRYQYLVSSAHLGAIFKDVSEEKQK